MMETFKKKYSQSDPFTDTLLSWSLEDICDEGLFKDKVKTIPESFESVKDYLGHYATPLMEETRAQLQSSMEILHRAPFAEVVDFHETKPFGDKVYQVRVNYWRNRFSDRSKGPYKTLPRDFMVLTDIKPESLSDLERVGKSWAFLSVTKVTEEDEEGDGLSSTYFKVKASKEIEVEFEQQSSMFVVFLANVCTNSRIWKALHMLGNSAILSQVLNVGFVDNLSCDCHEEVEILSDESLANGLISSLNESQHCAVFNCLHMLNCKKRSGFKLLWGPPGTGKTKTTATLLVCLAKMKRRTLICAPTNVAITEVASRVMRMLAETEVDLFCSLGDVLLFGNKERLKVGFETQDIYLDYRVQRLSECFGPLGLFSCFTSTINFLEDCVSQYNVYVENELIKESSNEKETKVMAPKEKLKTFLQYVRDRFVSNVTRLRKLIAFFCTHIPKSFILEANFQDLISLTKFLESLEWLLFQDNTASKELEKLFSCSEVIGDLSFVDITSLPSVKSACIYLLRSLNRSLKELKIPSSMGKKTITKFCFQRASLVFSTTSSSFKLHRMAIEPMTVLVIDEAAQLKECESIIPLQHPGIEHVVLVGDECQLPATVQSKANAEAGFGRSLFERLSSQNYPKHLLNTQYRMHPSISSFPNMKFYHNQIQDAVMVKRRSYEKHYLSGPMFGPYSFLNVIGGREEREDNGPSRRNMVEVAIVLKIIHCLHEGWLESQRKLSIGIVSPYAAQVVAIEDKLGTKYDKLDGFQVKVKTIDGFQGGEEDIIIISTVRSYGQNLEFISSPQRVNVALTRARHCLWILGNERTLTYSQSVWGSIVRDAKDRSCFFDAGDDKNLNDAILKVKKELDQLDDLLNADSALFKNSIWEVRFSDNFLKSFKKLPSARIKKSVLHLLLKLSSGWRPKRLTAASGSESSLEIMKFKVEGYFVISTVDIVKLSNYTQVLKIWDVLLPDDIPKLIKRLDAIFAKYTDEYASLCNEKTLEGNLEVPKSWPPSMVFVKLKDLSFNETGSDLAGAASDGRSYVENSKVSESLLLMKFYSLSYPAANHLLSDRDGRELDLPFEVTDEEMEIILFPRSSFILGRSGTGKTTVLTMKLFQKEQLHHKAKEELGIDHNNEIGHAVENDSSTKSLTENKATVLRQLFVTVSPKLCNAVKKHVSDLKRFACGGSKEEGSSLTELDPFDDEETQFKNIPDCFLDISPNSYPLVITFHKFLMMLDGTLSRSYFEGFVDMANVSQNQRQKSRSVALQTFLRTKEVNYDKFSVSYWPHFNSTLTKKLDPSSVFTEIISHIKGGPQAMDSSEFKLTREQYVMLSEGRSSKLTSEKRGAVYDLFQMYEKMKVENGEFDLADFVIDLHYRLRHERYEGDRVDFVYIDEVQDLTMSQIALFRHICNNVEEGFVFSGDTAQTIARGIAFRFQDIRSLFYNKFLFESKSDHDDRKEKGRVSPIVSLTQNFRTHAGILKLSQSIVELLYRFFPNSIDVLKPETSMIYGEAPILLQSGNENPIVKIFANDAKESGKMVGFGAEQVILVRDDNARREIADIMGKQALLLTILECKGLEFQDVLLYNFFGSSPLKNQWRVIYEYMKEQDMLDTESCKSPKFSESKHNILCSELKQLYVAVTRTKQRLWICESTEVSEPMFEYWKKKCLVQERQLNDTLAQAMQVASSPEEWRSRGIKLFYEKNYEWATVCFERAKDKYWERMAKASGLKAMSENIRTSRPEEANSVLREAAEIFEAIGKVDLAAKCFVDLGDYERAGRIYLEKFGDSELARAAECFSLAGCYKLSAGVYAKGNFFSECLNVCAKGELFNLGLEYIKQWKQQLGKDCGSSTGGEEIEKMKQVFLERCAFHYHEMKDKHSMMKFVRAFNSIDSIRTFLSPLGYLDELLSVEEETGNFVEAIDIAMMKGDILYVADLLGKAQKFKDAASLILFYVLAKSLWSPGQGWPLKQFKEKEELLRKAKSFAKNETQSFYEFVCLEVEIMSRDESDLGTIMTQMITSQKQLSIRGEYLLKRKVLEAHLSSKPNKYFWEEELVSDLKKHSEGMMSMNRVSVESLVYFWNSWRDNITNFFEYLSFQDSKEEDGYGELCLNFLGVWRQFCNSNPIYLLLRSDVDWAKDVPKRSLKNSMLISIDSNQLTSAASMYWSSEVLSVGTRVLEKLRAIYNQVRNRSQFCRCHILTFIYEVAHHLLQSKYLKPSHQISRTLDMFVRLAVDDYVKNAIPLDYHGSMTLGMFCLRGTDISRNLLMRFIAKYVGSREISYGKIGNITRIILGSGMIDSQIYETIKHYLNWNPPWKAFIVSLCGSISKPATGLTWRFHKGRLCSYVVEPEFVSNIIWKFQAALLDTSNVNLYGVTEDYITPHCFLYLVENLLIWAASVQGYIVTTKSMFLEWLMYQEDTKAYSSFVPVTPIVGLVEKIREFVVLVLKRFLNNEREMIEWMRRLSFSVINHHSVIVTRMVVIICLLQENFGKTAGLLFHMLQRTDISSLLPKEFREAILGGRNSNRQRAISEAFMMIDNPLVIVDLGGNCPVASCPNTVFVDMKVSRCKDDVLRTLFPQARYCAPQKQDEDSCREVASKTESINHNISKIPGTAGSEKALNQINNATANAHKSKAQTDSVEHGTNVEKRISLSTGDDKLLQTPMKAEGDVKKFFDLKGKLVAAMADQTNNATAKALDPINNATAKAHKSKAQTDSIEHGANVEKRISLSTGDDKLLQTPMNAEGEVKFFDMKGKLVAAIADHIDSGEAYGQKDCEEESSEESKSETACEASNATQSSKTESKHQKKKKKENQRKKKKKI